MTSTNQCVLGIGNKNSSRVLRPPGGGSTFNIFGVMPPEDTRKSKGAQPPAPLPEEKSTAVSETSNPTTESPLKGECGTQDDCKGERTDLKNDGEASNTDATDEVKKEEEEEESGTTDVSPENKSPANTAELNNISDQAASTVQPSKEDTKTDCEKSDSKTESVSPSAAPITKGKCKASAFNPITGEPYDKSTTSGQATVTNVRVRQPPGGASTKLW